MSQPALADYVDSLKREYASGIAGEHAYRPALKALLESFEKRLNAVNDPKRSAIGAPDFIVQRDIIPIGFVEAKDIGANLDEVEKSEQMGRYFKLRNLILTDYLQFRWYLDGQWQETVQIGELRDGVIHPSSDEFPRLASLLRRFLATVTPMVPTPQELAQRMAHLAQEIAYLIDRDLSSTDPSPELMGQFEAFQDTLVPDITIPQFADMYAQTLAFGLFAARVRHVGPRERFSMHEAFWSLPATNPFLKHLFQNIASSLGTRMTWMADTLAELMTHVDVESILAKLARRTRQQNPIIHFYETFLSVYNPHERERRGVYYTPEPVVSYIVRSVDYLLKERFGRYSGLADKNTLILDPATGTGTFLDSVIDHIHETMREQGQLGVWNRYVSEGLLPRLFGFELLMAPYAMAHMRLGIQLQQLGYQFDSDKRLEIYLTNTLEEGDIKSQKHQGFAQFIAEEANSATEIKREKPIMVVLGNPPYSGHSANTGEWISKLVRDYYQVDGQPLGERNPKWLQDDYVKFIRFGQWRIGQTGGGVLAFVTNHGYLDNLTFRGMRQQLMQAFDDIYILNLHGNSKKKETTPDGGKDENVFDIQQGVAIGVFVKDSNPSRQAEKGEKQGARVHYADLWGTRKGKYAALLANDLSDTNWTDLTPQAPFYLFVPQNLDLAGEYERGWKVTAVMAVNSLGITTARDHFTVHWSTQEVIATVKDFVTLSVEEARQKYRLGRDARDWKVSLAQDDLRKHGIENKYVARILYRPFDYRSTYYTGQTRGFMCMPRLDVMRHILTGENLALVTARGIEVAREYDQIFCTQDIIQLHTLSIKEVNTVLPLYLYPDPLQKPQTPESQALADAKNGWPGGPGGRVPNLNEKFVREMESKLGLSFVTDGRGDLEATFGPEDVFHYAYAVFHSPMYRERYAEFLKIDFPRLPLTSDKVLFKALCEKGAALVDLHLMRGGAFGKLVTKFPEGGDNTVASGYPKYTEPTSEKAGRVHINKTQYFEGIAPEVWEFHVGGYQVLEKWLKDRRGRALSFEDIMHYQKIVVALQDTIRLMDEIDDLIPAWPLT